MANEIDITDYVSDADHWHISNSVANLGDRAAQITWSNACAEAARAPLLKTPDEFDAMRQHLKEMGFSEAGDNHSDTELNALLLQLISGDVQEVCSDAEEGSDAWWCEYETGAEAGRYAGRMYRGGDGRVYYYLGS